MMIQSARIIFLHPQNESFNNCIVNKSRPTYELINKQVLVTGFIPPQTLCAAAEDDVTVNIYNFQELGMEQIDCPLLARAQPEGQSLG
jgi:hypothetical protein